MSLKPKPSSFISKQEANEMVSFFQTEKLPHLQGKHAMYLGETSSVWFSKKQISEILTEMDHQQATGLRVYLGAYPGTAGPELSNRISLVFTLTRINDLDDEEDIFLEETYNWAQRPDPVIEPSPVRGFNHGSISPPRHGGIRLPLDADEI